MCARSRGSADWSTGSVGCRTQFRRADHFADPRSRYAAAMPAELVVPSIAMSLAFLFYTGGVWAERAAKDLRLAHVLAFITGWGFDAWGTWLMEQLRVAGRESGLIHGLTGSSAFILMGLHAIWAAWVLWRGSEQARRGFHRYSIAVWTLWLVPYLGGMIAGIMRGAG